MSFKFNFNQDNDDSENKQDDNEEKLREFNVKDDSTVELCAQSCHFTASEVKESDIEIEKVLFKNNYQLKKLMKPLDIKPPHLNKNSNNDYEKLLTKSDLIPGVYEGGFKLWECAIDVINYLIENKINLKGKKVLEIGCGHGLPGIYCLLNGAHVTFQDYNEEVLYKLTQPNVNINCNGDYEMIENNTHFISGDWKFVSDILSKEKFDYILTSDTLYNVSSFSKLHSLISNHLEPIQGKCYLASKTYYFGVGGGIRKFEELIEILDILNVITVKDIKDGVSNVREIVEITLKKD